MAADGIAVGGGDIGWKAQSNTFHEFGVRLSLWELRKERQCAGHVDTLKLTKLLDTLAKGCAPFEKGRKARAKRRLCIRAEAYPV